MRPITYGRRSSKRHSEPSPQDSSGSLADRPRKRPKTDVEVVEPIMEEDVDSTRRDTVSPEPGQSRRSLSLSQSIPHQGRVAHLSRAPSSSTIKLTPTPTLPSDSSFQINSNPSTPRKRARDLSQLFELSPGSQTHNPIGGSGSGLAKRMLSRSRTELSFDSAKANPVHLKQRPLTSISSNSGSQVSLDTGSLSRSPSPSRVAHEPTAPAHTAAQTSSTIAHVRTYAGKSRSFLISLPTSELPSISDATLGMDAQDDPQDEFETRESYTDLRTRWGVDNSEDDPYPNRNHSPSHSSSESRPQSPTKPGKGKVKAHEPTVYANGLTNDLKSITELRSKGESRRFLDEVGYLFEGLERSGGVGVRRASALEIVTKLCSPNFSRKAKAADLHIRTWDVFVSAGATQDKILATIMAFFVALIARDPSSLLELVHRGGDGDVDTGIIETLLGLLNSSFGAGIGIGERERDILGFVTAGISDAELRRLGVTRIEKALLTTLVDTIAKKSDLFLYGTPISIRLLLSQALSAFPPSVLSPNHVTAILVSLRSELSLLTPRILAYTSGLSLLPRASSASSLDIPSFEHIDNCLRLLDSFLLGQWTADGDDVALETTKKDTLDSDRSGLADELVAICVATELLAQTTDSAKHGIAIKCTESAFRTLLSLTQDDPEWCQAILNNEMALLFIVRTIMQAHKHRSPALCNATEGTVPEVENESDAQVLDRMCLALGVLTNLVQVLDTAKDMLRKIWVDPKCIGKQTCVLLCECPRRSSALDCLTRVYVQLTRESSHADPGTNFLRGHLAVLLGLLMRDSKANQKMLLTALPGTTNRTKLASLAEQAQEFVTFYADLAVRLSTAANQNDRDDEDGPRSENNHTERMVTDSNGHVAQEVVTFLHKLSTQQA